MASPGMVSIILPTYNRAHLIAESIQSVLEQTYGNWELIVIDDGSTDGSEKIIREFNDSRIQYHYIEHSGLVGKVRNEGLKHAAGEYIAFHDSDDLWVPDKLNFQIDLLGQNSIATFISSNGDQFGKGATPTPAMPSLFIGRIFEDVLFNERLIFYAPTLVFKSTALQKIHGLDETIVSGSEFDFFLRLTFFYEGIFTGRSVVKIRKHDQNISTLTDQRPYPKLSVILQNLHDGKYLTREQLHELLARQYYRHAVMFLRKSLKAKARPSIRLFLRLKPASIKGWVRWFQTYCQ